MRVDHRFFSVSRLRLHALDFGGEGDPIVLLHGAGGHGWIWHDVAGQLTLWGGVLAVDLRGHGDSQWAAGYDATSCAEDVAAVIEQLGRPADLAGLGWGGQIAMRLASRHPGLVNRLAVLDVSTGPAAMPEVAGELATRAEVLTRFRDEEPDTAERLLTLVGDHGVRPAPSGGLQPKHDPAALRAIAADAERFDADWSALTVPTLLVRAERSARLTAPEFDAMLERQSRASGVVMNGGEHQLALERPFELADVLEAFIHEEALDATVIGEAREVLEIP